LEEEWRVMGVGGRKLGMRTIHWKNKNKRRVLSKNLAWLHHGFNMRRFSGLA
jgi:hypothetical protein